MPNVVNYCLTIAVFQLTCYFLASLELYSETLRLSDFQAAIEMAATMAALNFLRSLQIASIFIGIAFVESSLASIQRDGEACFAIASAIPQLKSLTGN
jgi:hypothetical protein